MLQMENSCFKHENGQVWSPWHQRMRFFDGLNFFVFLKKTKVYMEKIAGEQHLTTLTFSTDILQIFPKNQTGV